MRRIVVLPCLLLGEFAEGRTITMGEAQLLVTHCPAEYGNLLQPCELHVDFPTAGGVMEDMPSSMAPVSCNCLSYSSSR
jgi:hypothetical protein